MLRIRRNSYLLRKTAPLFLVGLFKKFQKSKLLDLCKLALLNHSIVKSLTPEFVSLLKIPKQILDNKLKSLTFHVSLKLLDLIDLNVISINSRTNVNFKEIMTYFWLISEFTKCYQNYSVKIFTPRKRCHAQSKFTG